MHSGSEADPIYFTRVTPNFSSKDAVMLAPFLRPASLALGLVILSSLLYFTRNDMQEVGLQSLQNKINKPTVQTIAKERMSSSAPVAIDSQYPVGVYVVLPLVTLYCGLYVIISNHYVLRPKIELFLEKAAISSSLASELIIDVLSNLSFISYAIAAIFLTPLSDHPLRTLQCYSSYWMTICLAVVMYMKCPAEEQISRVVLVKNALVLLLIGMNLVYHYFQGSSLMTLPLIMVGLYIVNIFINSNEEKFISLVYEILAIKQRNHQKPRPKMTSSLPTIEHLSVHYPVQTQELRDEMEKYRATRRDPDAVKNSRTQKNYQRQIDTKMVARQKLMEICTSIHLSLKKKQEEDIAAVRQYFGALNGTINDRPAYEGVRPKPTLTNSKPLSKKSKSRAKERTIAINEAADKKNSQKEGIKQRVVTEAAELTGANLVTSEKDNTNQDLITFKSEEADNSLLFYIFPVKLFEFSRVISVVVSLVANIGFGILLDYTQNVLNTLRYGRYAEFMLAALLLPIIPSAHFVEYYNTMALSTIWKFGLVGLVASLSLIDNTSGSLDIGWHMTPYLQYQAIAQMITLLATFWLVVTDRNRYKTQVLLFLLSLAANAGITYLSITS